MSSTLINHYFQSLTPNQMAITETIRFNANVQGALSGFQQIESKANALSSKLSSIGGTAVGAGAAIAVPITAGLGVAVKEALAFEEATADLNKVINASDKVVKSFSGNILKLSRDIPIAATGLQQIAAAGAQMGIPQKQLLRFTEITAKAGVAFDITAAQAGESIGKISNIMGVGIDEIENLLGAVNHLSNNMAAKAPEIVNTLQRIGGTAKTFGLVGSEAAALSSAFIALGKPPEVAATGINALLTKMQTATGQSKGFREALGAIGLSAEELERSVREKGSQSIVDFLKRIQQLDEAQRPKILLELFGSEYQDDISLVTTNLNVLEQALGLASDRALTATSLQDEFAARSATTANQLQLLGNNFREIGITIGSAILPALNNTLKAIQPVIVGFADFAQAHPRIVTVGVAFAGVAAAAGGFLVVAGTVATAVGGLITTFTTLAPVVAGAGVAIGAIAAPVALGVAALASIGVVVYQVITNWDALKDTTAAVFGAVKATIVSWVTEVRFRFVQVKQYVTDTFGGIVNAVRTRIGEVVSQAQSMANQVITAVKALPNQALAAGRSLVGNFAQGIIAAASAPIEAVQDMVTRIRGLLPSSPAKWGALSDIDRVGQGMMGTISKGIKQSAHLPVRATHSVAGDIRREFTSASSGSNNGDIVNIEYKPNITINSSADPQAIINALESRDEQFMDLIERVTGRRSRTEFA
ncbi:MAG: phage tail tape measure protein [Symploca sp. SIO2G7]|nr:phage tail tape measure protein [Symploca sp. SIO2G7]